MQRVCVSCDDPLNQLSRIIDILRRMDATLVSLNLNQTDDGAYEAAINFAFSSVAWTNTFLARLHLVPGVEVHDSPTVVQLVSPAQSDRCATA